MNLSISEIHSLPFRFKFKHNFLSMTVPIISCIQLKFIVLYRGCRTYRHPAKS